MEEKIKKIQRYLLNPKEAIKDKFSFFDSLHDILKLEKQEAHSKYNKEVYQLYWAIFAFFLEPYETERQCCCVPIENGKKKWNEAKIIHTIYLDRNEREREIENKSNPITEEEWDNLQFTGKVIEKIESVPDLNTGEILKIKKGYREERESDDYTLEFQYKFHFYADEALGFNLHSLSPANYNDLKTDRHIYLENGFYSGTANIHRERHFLWQDFKGCHSKWDNLNPKKEQEYTPLKRICNTYNKIGFIYQTEVDYSEYVKKLDESSKINSDTIPQLSVEEKSNRLTLGILSPDQTYKFYEECNNIVFNYCSFDDFVSSFTTFQDQKLKVKNQNLFLVIASFWSNIFRKDISESNDFIVSIEGITMERLKKKKITDKTSKTEKQTDLSKKLSEFL